MAKERTSVRMQAQIKIMSEQGYSLRAIARALKLSRKTVRKYLAVPAAEVPGAATWTSGVDWEYVRKQVYGKGNHHQADSPGGDAGSYVFEFLAGVSGPDIPSGLS